VVFKKVKLKAWDELTNFAEKTYVYRGQQCDKWRLMTRLDRFCKRWRIVTAKKRRAAELNACRDFRRAYHQYGLHIPAQGFGLEWLALMQHYGSPTRLLDFTYTIYVAAYFALENAEPPASAAVWRINPRWAMHESIDLLSNAGHSQAPALGEPYHEGSEAVCNETLLHERSVLCACPQTPFRLNERLRIQMGVFMVPGRADFDFEDNLRALPGHKQEENVLKIVIPTRYGKVALPELFDMGLSRRSLFPGLDGYAKSLDVYTPAVNNPRDWSRP
jgi:hypothetical protein